MASEKDNIEFYTLSTLLPCILLFFVIVYKNNLLFSPEYYDYFLIITLCTLIPYVQIKYHNLNFYLLWFSYNN